MDFYCGETVTLLMRNRILLSALLLLGVVEILYGVLMGPLLIYAHEAPFALAMKHTQWEPQQLIAFGHYIDLFKQQWYIVLWFGVATIILAVILWFFLPSKDRITPAIK